MFVYLMKRKFLEHLHIVLSCLFFFFFFFFEWRSLLTLCVFWSENRDQRCGRYEPVKLGKYYNHTNMTFITSTASKKKRKKIECKGSRDDTYWHTHIDTRSLLQYRCRQRFFRYERCVIVHGTLVSFKKKKKKSEPSIQTCLCQVHNLDDKWRREPWKGDRTETVFIQTSLGIFMLRCGKVL